STIVLLGDQLLRDQNRDPSTLQTVSCVYEESDTCDESRFIHNIEQHRNHSTFKISEREQNITLGLFDEVAFKGIPSPLDCFPGRYRTFSTLLRQHNSRVLFTGL